jgi:hypothetical protein
MKALLILAALLVGGVAVATPPIHDDTNEVIYQQCNQVASFARSIATLKVSGITETDLVQYISQPTVQTFPVTLIRRQIYAENISPVAAYQAYYTRCLVVGYNDLLQSMKDADELVALRDENRKLKSQLAQAQVYQNQLNYAIALQRVENEDLKKQVPQKPVKAYGAPLDPVEVHDQ